MNSRVKKKKLRAESKEFFKGCRVYSFKAFDFIQAYTCKPKQRYAFRISVSYLLKLGLVRDSSNKGRKQ